MDKVIKYKDYSIKIVPQPNKGDLKETFFRVYQETEDSSAFILWQRISGTSQAIHDITDDQAFVLLEEEGLKQVKRIMDHEYFKDQNEFKFDV